MTTLSRRNLLKATAGLGLSALLAPEVGHTQTSTDSRKLLFIYAEGGWTHRALKMRPPWAPPEWSEFELYAPEFFLVPDDGEFEFDLTDSRLTEDDFSRLLKPLFRHRDIMTVTEGLAMLTTALDAFGDAHAQAHLHAWSAYPAISGEDGPRSRGGAPSLDQRIHEHIRQSNPDHQTMDFRLMAPELYHEWLYQSDGSGGAARLPTETDPGAAFSRFFGSVDEADPLTANANISLAIARAQFEQLAPRLPREDQIKLEAHRDMLSTLERRLGNRVSCDGGLKPPDTTGMSRVEKFETDFTSFGQLIAAGLACGVSRVATLGSITPFPEAYGLPASTDIHHEFEHPTDPLVYFEGMPSEAYLDKEETMVQRNIMQMDALARLLDVLRATPDGEGNLLDNTVVVYMSELSHGNHGHEHYPSLIFGSGGGMITPGRYIKYAQNNPNPWGRNYYNEYTGTAHSKLLVSLAQGFGLEMNDFGAATVPGEAPHVANSNRDVELSGPLPRLKI